MQVKLFRIQVQHSYALKWNFVKIEFNLKTQLDYKVEFLVPSKQTSKLFGQVTEMQ